MTKRSRKIVEYHRNEVAAYFRGEIEDHILFIKKMLRPLTELATYNAETEDAEVRADRADDMRRGIEYRLGEITREVEEITRLIKGGKKSMQNWIKDDCNAYFTMSEEEFQGLMQRQEDTDAPEDPELTEEQEQALLEEEDEILARLRDIDPAYDYVNRI